MIKSVFALASLGAQTVYLVGFVFLLIDLYGLGYMMTPAMRESPTLLAPYILDTVFSYWSTIGIGMIGAMMAWALCSRGNYRKSWYLNGIRLFGYLWLPFVPVGTLIGVVLLHTHKAVMRREENNNAT